MNDNARVCAGAMVGAILGGVAAHLLLTAQGQRTLRDLRPALADLSRAALDLRSTLEKLGSVTREGQRAARAFGSTAG